VKANNLPISETITHEHTREIAKKLGKKVNLGHLIKDYEVSEKTSNCV
jgi:hypothetical protein